MTDKPKGIRRYVCHCHQSEEDVWFEQDGDGKWMRYDDYENKIERIKLALEALQQATASTWVAEEIDDIITHTVLDGEE